MEPIAPIGGIFAKYHNLRAIPNNGDSAAIRFDIETDTPDEIKTIVYLNGKPNKTLFQSTETGLANLGYGLNRIELKAYALNEIPLRLEGDFNGGTEAFLSWQRSTAADLAGYRVYWDAGTGGSLSALATVTRIVAQPVPVAASTGTACTGRVEFSGDYTGSPINAAVEVTITAPGVGEYAVGADTGPFTLSQQGDTVALPWGLQARFLDPVADYATGAQYETWVGPATEYETNTLAEGTYRFAVQAYDAALNESATTQSITIPITYPPGSVTNPELVYHPAVGPALAYWELNWTNPTDPDFANVDIYSNFNSITGIVEPYVIEDVPLYSTSAETFTVDIPTSQNTKTWMFYVRTRDTTDRTDESINMLVGALPYVPANLDEPANLRVVTVSPGQYRLSWSYGFKEREALTGFRVYAKKNGNPFTATPLTIGAGVQPPLTARDYSTVFVAAVLGATTGDTINFAVRSTDGTTETVNTNTVSVVVDTTAPAFAGIALALPN